MVDEAATHLIKQEAAEAVAPTIEVVREPILVKAIRREVRYHEPAGVNCARPTEEWGYYTKEDWQLVLTALDDRGEREHLYVNVSVTPRFRYLMLFRFVMRPLHRVCVFPGILPLRRHPAV
jgi:hypothetical protein